jgi:hypothetical protein
MKLGFFPVGQRYRSRDLYPPVWLAAYDVVNLSCFEESRYTTLRENRSPRENLLLKRGLDLMDRRIYKTLSTRGNVDDAAPVLMAVSFIVRNEHLVEINSWYEEVGSSNAYSDQPRALTYYVGALGSHIEDSRLA